MSTGLRANKEHALLHGNTFYFDNYVAPSDVKYGVINGHIRKRGSVDKTVRSSTNNSFTREETEFLPIPVGDFDGKVYMLLCSTHSTLIYFNFVDMNDRGAIVHRCLQKLSPGQHSFYSHEATSENKFEFRQTGYPSACMSPNKPLGANTTSPRFKEFPRKIGVNDWKSFGSHSLRAWFCT